MACGAVRARQPGRFSRDLAAAINKVLDNPELAESMAAAGQQRAREVFSWSSIAQQTKKLYDSLVK
jgi:starch synthase